MNEENKKNNSQQDIVRSVLKSEFTWVLVIIGAVWGFVGLVILPLQEIQINIKAIQQSQLEQKISYEKFDARLTLVENTLIKLTSQQN